MTIFRCPLCGGPLWEVPGGLRCPKGHRFDRAKEGYVHLLPPHRRHSKSPGDDRKMVAARAAFLERGYTRPQACAQCPYFVLCRGAVPGTGPCSPPVEKITTAQPSANFLHMLCHACVRRRQPSHDKKKALSGPSGPLRAFYKVRMEVPS